MRIETLPKRLRLEASPDNRRALYLRALALYELQLWLTSPATPSRGRDARVSACAKLMEYREGRLARKLGHRPSLQELAEDAAYRSLYRAFRKCGGFKRLRHSESTPALVNQVAAEDDALQLVADLVDVSIRFDKTTILTRNRGGITTAVEYLEHQTSSRKKTVLLEAWGDHKDFACWIYLLTRQRIEILNPPRLLLNNFSRRLLFQAKQLDELHECLSAYCVARELLVARGYDVPHLDGFVPKAFPLAIDPLDPATLSALMWTK